MAKAEAANTIGAVLIPGFMLDRDLWTDIEPTLASLGPVLHSDPSVGDSIEAMARYTLALAPECFNLIGFSMGGYVAREMARMAPQRVKRLILIATSSRGDSDLQERRKAEALKLMPATFGGVSRKSLRLSLAPAREHDDQLIDRIHAMSIRLGGETFRRQAAMRRDGDLERLGEIACPSLIVAASQDRLRSLEESEELHAGIPGSRMRVLDSGHMIPMEAPEALGRVLMEFIQES